MKKNVVVTGGAGGLGIEIVKQHLEQGDRVWAIDLNESTLMSELKKTKSDQELYFFPCDISSTDQVNAAAKIIVNSIDAVDRIYSCAGVCRVQDRVPLGETNLDAIPLIVDINAVGFLRIIKGLLPVIKNN